LSALFLIGPRGAGKSAAGAVAARRLGAAFVDVDALIESKAGRTIAEIFAADGEPAFRALERREMIRLLDEADEPRVIATGGGCILDAEVRERLGRHGGVAWLRAAVEILQRRIRGSSRPSLTGDDPAAELPRVVQQREPLYRAAAAAGLTVDTGERSVDEVAEILVRHLRIKSDREGV
jgi:shikimate kinase